MRVIITVIRISWLDFVSCVFLVYFTECIENPHSQNKLYKLLGSRPHFIGDVIKPVMLLNMWCNSGSVMLFSFKPRSQISTSFWIIFVPLREHTQIYTHTHKHTHAESFIFEYVRFQSAALVLNLETLQYCFSYYRCATRLISRIWTTGRNITKRLFKTHHRMYSNPFGEIHLKPKNTSLWRT